MQKIIDNDAVLFERLRARLTAISRRIVGSQADAEDIVQDCFLKWRAVDQSALLTPAAWLTTVIQHQSIDHLRRRAREAEAALGAMALQPTSAPGLPGHLLLQADLADALARLVARLSPSERMALVLREVFDLSHADIAVILGASKVNARQYLSRARRRLRESEDAGADQTEPGERLGRELITRFQAAIHGLDMPALVNLLGAEQPMSVAPAMRLPAAGVGAGAGPANDGQYRLAA